MQINNLFPCREFYQGDTFSFNLRLTDYDPNVWTVTYYFAKAESSFNFASTATSDGSFLMEVQATTTATYAPGLYYVSAVLTDTNGNKFTAGQTEILIKPDVTKFSDPRSANRIALDAVTAALASAAPGAGIIEYTVGGTTMKKDYKSLLALRSFYLKLVRQEDKKPAISHIYYNL